MFWIENNKKKKNYFRVGCADESPELGTNVVNISIELASVYRSFFVWYVWRFFVGEYKDGMISVFSERPHDITFHHLMTHDIYVASNVVFILALHEISICQHVSYARV